MIITVNILVNQHQVTMTTESKDPGAITMSSIMKKITIMDNTVTIVVLEIVIIIVKVDSINPSTKDVILIKVLVTTKASILILVTKVTIRAITQRRVNK